MKYAIFFLIGVSLFSLLLYLAYLSPYHIYTVALSEGLSTDYVKIKKLPEEILKGGIYRLEKTNGLEKGTDGPDRLWPLFHFSHFKIPFPVHHPLYNIVAKIEIDKKRRPHLGIDITDRKNSVMTHLKLKDLVKLSLQIGKYKLFNLPIYKKMILNTELDKIWDDLFLRDITLPEYESLGFFNYVKEIKKHSYEELVYNLFILKLRSEFFPENSFRIGMLEGKKLGVVEVKSAHKRFSKELIYLRERNNIRILDLTSKKFSKPSQEYRERILKNISFKESFEESSVSLYSLFRELEYDRKTDQEGMIYLYSAWSHSIRKKEFLIQMIQWLERGEDNIHQLLPLYSFSTKFYGESFSTKEQLKEDAKRRLERKIKEELEQELRDEKGNIYKIYNEKFESDQKKMDYFLQKSKDDKINSDDDEGIILVE